MANKAAYYGAEIGQSNCGCGRRLEEEYKKQHALENTIEEYMVSNRKLSGLLRQTQAKVAEIQKKHSGCDKKILKYKEEIKKLSNDKSDLWEKWIKLSTKNKQDNVKKERFKELEIIHENSKQEISTLAQRLTDLEHENVTLRKDKDMQKILIDKQNSKIRELKQMVEQLRHMSIRQQEN